MTAEHDQTRIPDLEVSSRPPSPSKIRLPKDFVDIYRALTRNRLALVGLIGMVLILLGAVFADEMP